MLLIYKLVINCFKAHQMNNNNKVYIDARHAHCDSGIVHYTDIDEFDDYLIEIEKPHTIRHKRTNEIIFEHYDRDGDYLYVLLKHNDGKMKKVFKDKLVNLMFNGYD